MFSWLAQRIAKIAISSVMTHVGIGNLLKRALPGLIRVEETAHNTEESLENITYEVKQLERDYKKLEGKIEDLEYEVQRVRQSYKQIFPNGINLKRQRKSSKKTTKETKE